MLDLSRVTPKICLIDGQPFTSSKNIAEYFKRRHCDVLKKISCIDCSKEFSQANFLRFKQVNQSGEEEIEYQVTRNGFSLLSMTFFGKDVPGAREAYFEEFSRVEKTLLAKQSKLPPSRFMICFSEDGQRSVTPIGDDCFVAPIRNFSKIIKNSRISESELREIVFVCNEKMERVYSRANNSE